MEGTKRSGAIGRNVVLAVLVSGAFLAILNQTLLVTAIPVFMRDFDISASTAQWLTTIFMLINGILIPITAFLIYRFTTRTLFLTAMGLFSFGTLICIVAPDYPVMMLGRIVQASGAGIILPLMQTILFAVFPLDKRGTAMGTFGLVIAFAPAIGPSLSGWIIDHYPWRVIFVMILPLAIIDLIIAYFVLRNVTERTFPKLDPGSIMLSTLGFGGLLFGFSAAGNTGWASLRVLLALGIGAVSLSIFIWRQLTMRQPILEFRVFRSAMFSLNTALGMAVFTLMIGAETVLPIYMQDMLDYSRTASGLALLPGAAVMGLSSPITGRVFDLIGAKWLAITGLTIVTAATFMYTQLTSDTSFAYITIIYAVRMFGTAMVMMPVTTAALNQLPQRLIPHGTAMNNTMRQIAASIGTAIFVSVMSNAALDPDTHGMEGLVHGVNMSFLVGGIIGIVAIMLAPFIKNLHRGDAPPDEQTTAEPAAE